MTANAGLIRLEKRIAADERGGILHRWRYGRALLAAKAGRKQLPHGMTADLVHAAERAGLKLSEREIQYRLQCAEAYATEVEVRTACADFGTWSDLRAAGFPPVEAGLFDIDDLEASGLTSAPDGWEQLSLPIPGLKAELSIRGRRVPLRKGGGGATVADVAAYVDQILEMHDNFGKTVHLAMESLRLMREGAAGDEETNAVEAFERAAGADYKQAS